MLSSRYSPRLGVSLMLDNVGIVTSSRNKSQQNLRVRERQIGLDAKFQDNS